MANNQYNPYYDVNAIYNFKGQYDKAIASGNSKLAQEIANKAQQNYASLRGNGREDIAKSLGDTGYAGAKAIRDKYAMTGKVAIRPYLYNSKLKTKYGLSDEDIDKNLSFNETTGEVFLGGINLGTPYSNVDGTTYWDASVLDKGVEDYLSHSGISPKTEINVFDKTGDLYKLQREDHADITGKYDELYDYAMDTNPLETETGKAIMDDYNIRGEKASNEIKADGAASNSGNVDSYAEANAFRQQAALTAQGHQAAIAAQTQRINDVRGVLGDMGAYQNNSYTGMQNTIALDTQTDMNIADATGVVPKAWNIKNNRYFTNGTLTNPDLDYGVIIENTKNALSLASDETKKAELQQKLNDAIVARDYKTSPENYGGKWSKYAQDLTGYVPEQTQGAALNKEAQAMNKIIANISSGIPITQEMLDLAGYSNYTPETFTRDYLANISKIMEINSSGSSGSSGSSAARGSSRSSGSTLIRPTTSMYNAVNDMLGRNGDGFDGLAQLLDTYDWAKYDINAIIDYLKTYYPGDELNDFLDEYVEPDISEVYANNVDAATGHVLVGGEYIDSDTFLRDVENGKIGYDRSEFYYVEN